MKLISATLTALLPLVAHAVPVAPGTTTAVPGATVGDRPDLAGTVANDGLLPIFDLDPSALGLAGYHIQNRVVSSTTLNTLIFAPRLRDPHNITGSDMLIDRVVLTGYAGWSLDVTYKTDGDGDRGPTSVTRSADGDSLDFTFGFPLVSGNLAEDVHEESHFLQILTEATDFAYTGRATIYGRLPTLSSDPFIAEVTGLAVPTTTPAVPLPASAWALLAALGTLTAMRRR